MSENKFKNQIWMRDADGFEYQSPRTAGMPGATEDEIKNKIKALNEGRIQELQGLGIFFFAREGYIPSQKFEPKIEYDRRRETITLFLSSAPHYTEDKGAFDLMKTFDDHRVIGIRLKIKENLNTKCHPMRQMRKLIFYVKRVWNKRGI